MEQIKELEEVLELLNTKQYTKLRQYLAELNDADIAGLLEELEEEEMLKVFRILPKDLAADVFSYLDMDNQQKIITSLSDKEASDQRKPRCAQRYQSSAALSGRFRRKYHDGRIC